MQFNVGDVVQTVKADPDMEMKIGAVGTVICIKHEGSKLGVSWFNYKNGHNLELRLGNLSGWYVPSSIVAHLEEENE